MLKHLYALIWVTPKRKHKSGRQCGKWEMYQARQISANIKLNWIEREIINLVAGEAKISGQHPFWAENSQNSAGAKLWNMSHFCSQVMMKNVVDWRSS